MYEALLVVHVLSGFAWVGGGFVLMLGARNIKAADGQEAVDQMVGAFEKTTTLLFTIAPLLVLATGIAQVAMSSQHEFSQLWIILALVLFVVTGIMGGGIGGRWEKQMKEAREDGRSLPDIFDRWLRLGWIEMLVLAVIVALMVYKPT